MINFLLTISDVSQEVVQKTKDFFVSSEFELKNELTKRGVDIKKVIDIKTNNPVENWNNILGVFKKGENIYAYTNNLESEINASLKIFS